MPAATARLLPWLLGFGLTANLYAAPQLALSPRLTDLVGLAAVPWVLLRLLAGGVPAAPLAGLLLLALAPLGWAFVAWPARDTATLAQAARWLLAAPWALLLLRATAGEARQAAFLHGLLWGAAANVAVVFMQATGLEHVARRLGLSAGDASFTHWVYQAVRIPGLHGHHAASAAVTSLAIPAALHLYFLRRAGVWLPLAAGAGVLAVLHLTSTRSPLLVALATCGAYLVAARQPRRALALAAPLAVGLLAALLVLGPPGGRLRWLDAVSTEANASERLASGWAAASLSASHPLGLGVTRGATQLMEISSINATHNAILQATLFFGLPLGLCVLAGLAGAMWRARRGPAAPRWLEGMLALHLAGLFLFEEHLNNPTFVILACWIFASWLAGGAGAGGAGAEAVATSPDRGEPQR